MRYKRTFKCPKCLLVHVVTSKRNDLDKKQADRVESCIRKKMK